MPLREISEMNTIIIERVPGDVDQFHTISTDAKDWEAVFEKLVKARKKIRYSVVNMSVIPNAIKDLLGKLGYYKQVLAGDHDEQFLIPRNASE